MARVVLLNKPYGVLCQFRANGDDPTLADYIDIPGVYPAGRLDKDSEGLLLLTDDGALQHQLSHPRHKQWKTYLVQVEGLPDEAQLAALRSGVVLNDGPTRAAAVVVIPEPSLWPRDPPIRYRASIPTSWLEISIREGRNRQVRRMTAAVGLPTLRLVRVALGPWQLGDIPPGEWTLVQPPEPLRARRPTRSGPTRKHRRMP